LTHIPVKRSPSTSTRGVTPWERTDDTMNSPASSSPTRLTQQHRAPAFAMPIATFDSAPT
jgi:hypothetical protein